MSTQTWLADGSGHKYPNRMAADSIGWQPRVSGRGAGSWKSRKRKRGAHTVHPINGYVHVPSLYVAFALKLEASVSLHPPYLRRRWRKGMVMVEEASAREHGRE